MGIEDDINAGQSTVGTGTPDLPAWVKAILPGYTGDDCYSGSPKDWVNHMAPPCKATFWANPLGWSWRFLQLGLSGGGGMTAFDDPVGTGGSSSRAPWKDPSLGSSAPSGPTGTTTNHLERPESAVGTLQGSSSSSGTGKVVLAGGLAAVGLHLLGVI